MQEREILFRGQRVDTGEWVHGFYYKAKFYATDKELCDYITVPYPDEEGRRSDHFMIDPETLGRYTGLTDKNNKKIFEGDIVSNEWCLISGNSVVKFGEYRGSYMSKEYQQGHYGFHLEHLDPSEEAITRKDMMYFANRCEVIGNIHDNPELIKE